MALKTKLDVYPLENYTLGGSPTGGERGAQEKRHKTPLEKLRSLKARCQDEPCVQSVEGVLVVHLHRHPHVLLVKESLHRNADATGARVMGAPSKVGNVEFTYRLPGGRCRRGEMEEACLLRKLGRQLLGDVKVPKGGGAEAAGGGTAAAASDTVVDLGGGGATSKAASVFRVGEALSRWHRPHFNPLMYPYVPPHIAQAHVKEVRTVFLVHMEPSAYFHLNKSGELVAAPLFDLYDNAAKYGPIISSLPLLLSRVVINYCSTDY